MTLTVVARNPGCSACDGCTVRSSGLCRVFEPETRCEISRRSTRTLFGKGRTILAQGDPMSKVGVIVSGLVKIDMIDEEGDEHLLQLLHAGSLVGDMATEECAFSWKAATDVELCWMPPAGLRRIMQTHPEAYQAHLLASMLQIREQQFAQLSIRCRNSLERVAYWLSVQIAAGARPDPRRIEILLSRRDLASLLNMTVETLSRMLHQLADSGAIHLVTPEIVELRDAETLRLLARDGGGRLKESLVGEGWEWGARPLGTRPRGVTGPAGHLPQPGDGRLGRGDANRH